MTITSDFEGNSNVKLQCFAPKGTTLETEEGWRSTAYRKRVERTAVAFNVGKDKEEAVRYITIIYPTEDSAKAPKLSASFKNKKFDENALEVEVKIDGKKQSLKYKISNE